ncbi:unnamed protein product [Owenia fusiformis]|uniref:Tetraspanin n=1 Tax=Owenia fusiformis TaxID=6347 RepID=A0A8J1TUZ0_OWEFU|nr:unnamed protein product [Owenia fusiformis]
MSFNENKRHRCDKKGKDIRILGAVLTGALLLQGLTLLGVGIWVVSEHRIPACEFIEVYLIEGYITIVIGVILTVLNLLAVYVIWRGSNFVQIRGFFVVLGVVIILEVTVAILSGTHRQEINSGAWLAKMWASTLSSYTDENAKECWENLQTTKQCCGTVNYSDWLILHDTMVSENQTNFTDASLPKSCSCFKEYNSKCETVLDSSRNLTIYTQGCYYALRPEFTTFLDLLRILVPALAIVQLIHSVFTLFTSLHIQAPKDIDIAPVHQKSVVYRVS